VSVAIVGCVVTLTGAAQQGRVYTAADYKQAEKFMDYNVGDLVMHAVERPTWMADGRFWFSDTGANGVTYMLVDPAKGTKATAFDHAKLAEALNALPPVPGRGGQTPAKADPKHLVITEMSFEDGDKTVVVTVGGRQLKCDLSGSGSCVPSGAGGGRERTGDAAHHRRRKGLWLRHR
jgi:dipeptidyl-peptidase-4